MQVLQGRQISSDQLLGQGPLAEALLAQESVEVHQQSGLAFVAGAAQASKLDEIPQSVAQHTGKEWFVHGFTSGHDKATGSSVSKATLV